MDGAKCIGGQMTLKLCTAKCQKNNPRFYEYLKIVGWLGLINKHNSKPKRWLKPSSTGTKVNFEVLQSEQDCAAELYRLKAYIDDFNKKFGTDLKLEIN